MIMKFKDSDLEELAYDLDYKSQWSKPIVKLYRRRINLISAANDRRDIYAVKGLHLEKLKGDRQHQHSIKLDNQFRLIIEFTKEEKIEIVEIIEIEDYH